MQQHSVKEGEISLGDLYFDYLLKPVLQQGSHVLS